MRLCAALPKINQLALQSANRLAFLVILGLVPCIHAAAQVKVVSVIRGQTVECNYDGIRTSAVIGASDGKFILVSEKLKSLERRIRILRGKRSLRSDEARRLETLQRYRKEWKSVLSLAKIECLKGDKGTPVAPLPTATVVATASSGATETPSVPTPTPTDTTTPTSTPTHTVTPTATSTLQPGTDGVGYPSDANIIDLVRDYPKIKGDGITDNTDEILRALKEHNSTSSASNIVNPRTIYFRKGTYLVSRTIFAESTRDPGQPTSTIRLVGEDRDGTVIKLKDRTFTGPALRYFIQTGNYERPPDPSPPLPTPTPTPRPTPQPNAGYANYIENLTIDTGVGNPGAVALRYDVANMGALRDVTIRSGDGNGKYGVQFFTNAGPGLVQRVKLNGFEVGVHFGSTAVNNIVFDKIEVSDCQTGIENSGKNIQINGLVTHNVPTPLRSRNAHAVNVLVDADFNMGSGATSQPAAIDLGDNGFLFARNIVASTAFASIVKYSAGTIPGVVRANNLVRALGEWSSLPAMRGTSGHAYTARATEVVSLNLPIKDAPRLDPLTTPGYASWANVVDYGAIANDGIDDTSAFQRAIDESGKPIVYVPYGTYTIAGTVTIGPRIERFDAIFSQVLGSGTLVIAPRDSTSRGNTVWIQNLVTPNLRIRNESSGQVVLSNVKAKKILSTAGEIFLENIGPQSEVSIQSSSAWIRQINREIVGLFNRGGKVWVLGDNIEGKGTEPTFDRYPYQPSFLTTDGGMSEVLGGAVDALRYYGKTRQVQPIYSSVTAPGSTGPSRISVVAGSLEGQAVDGVTGTPIASDGKIVFGSWDIYVIDDFPPGLRVMLTDTHGVKIPIGTVQRRSFISLYVSP